MGKGTAYYIYYARGTQSQSLRFFSGGLLATPGRPSARGRTVPCRTEVVTVAGCGMVATSYVLATQLLESSGVT